MDVNRDPRVISMCGKAGLKPQLVQMLDQLQRCQKSLNEFLEVITVNYYKEFIPLFYKHSNKTIKNWFCFQEKRSIFPRFYFIGDDDLLEILGQSTNPVVIQTHLKKLFAGIHTVQFDNGNKNILAMVSLDGETVPLLKQIQIVPEVEVTVAFSYAVFKLK
jgi:dynein heavy chain 2